MRKTIAIAAAALMAAATPAVAAPEKAPSAPEAAETPAPNAKTRYCVDATTTGTRVPKRICKTRADWIAEHDFDPLNPQR